MKLKSLITILFNSVFEEEVRNLGLYRFYFNNDDELLNEIININNSFDSSDERLSDPKLISDWIINQMDVKIYVPDLEKINSKYYKAPNGNLLEEMKETDPEGYGFLIGH